LAPRKASAGAFAAEIGVVHLNLALQALGRVALQHDPFELVLHLPRRRLGDAKPSRKFDAGNSFLGLREQIDGLEPQPQPQLARGEDGPGAHGRLLAAGVALEQLAGAARDDAMRLAAAIGTFEAVGPAPFDKRRVALLLAPIGFVEIGLTEAFLKLHLIARHRRSLPKTICSVFVLEKNPS
jgi:hypothetical protein